MFMSSAGLLDTAFLPNCLVIARAAPAPTADALDLLVLLQLFSGHAADACAVEVGLLGLDASQAAQLLEKKLPVSAGAQFVEKRKSATALTFS
jgi:hypothetical protein